MYEMRLFCDALAGDAAVNSAVSAAPTIAYVHEGAANIAGVSLEQGEATYVRDEYTTHAGAGGATIWRWEIVRRDTAPNMLFGAGMTSRLRMAREVKMFELVPTSRWLFRLDSIIGFQGTTGVHSHPGSGIRCLIEGHIRIEGTKAEDSDNRATGDAWYEEGAYPVVSTADPGFKTTFVRGMILPPEYYGFADSATWSSGQPEGGPKKEGHRALVDQIITLQ